MPPASTSPHPAPAPSRRTPGPLRWLLIVVAFLGVTWALLNPAFQSPDEDIHYGYVQSLAEEGRLPGVPGRPAISEQTRVLRDGTNTLDSVYHPDTRTAAGPAAEAQVAEGLRVASPKDGGGSSGAAGYPPFAYAVLGVGYQPGKLGGAEERFFAARVTSALAMLVTAAAAWLLAGELFGRRRLPQLLAAAVVGLWPMSLFISASVNVDGVLLALWGLAMWLGVRTVMRGATPAPALALGVVVGLAMITKASSLALIPAVLAAGAWGVAATWRTGRRGMAAVSAVALLVPLLLISGAWTVIREAAGDAAYAQVAQAASVGGGAEGFSPRGFVSYLWQFYLPILPFMQDQRLVLSVISDVPVLNTWFGQLWGVYGWAAVWFPKWVYVVFGVVTAAGLGRFAWWAAPRLRRPSRTPPSTWAALVYLLLVAGGLLAGIHLTDYQLLTRRTVFAQGRYLLPLMPLAALAFAAGVASLRPAWAVRWSALALGGLVALNLASYALIVDRFYV